MNASSAALLQPNIGMERTRRAGSFGSAWRIAGLLIPKPLGCQKLFKEDLILC